MSITLSPPLTSAEKESKEHHWTVEEFNQAASTGVFNDPGLLEIIHGRIIEKMPEGGRHTGLRRRMARHLRAVLEPSSFVCEECPLRIAFDGEPTPDIMFTRQEDYGDSHPMPTDVVLLIEVSDSSVERDLGEKALLYAQAGIFDYWVVLVNESIIVVHRKPSPEGYQEVTRLAGNDTLLPLARPEAVFDDQRTVGAHRCAGGELTGNTHSYIFPGMTS